MINSYAFTHIQNFDPIHDEAAAARAPFLPHDEKIAVLIDANVSEDTQSRLAHHLPTPTDDVSYLDDSKRPRGRIPRGAWGYTLYLYDHKRETLKEIGDRFGVEPSAVHYVLRQARQKNIPYSREVPTAEILAKPRREIESRAANLSQMPVTDDGKRHFTKTTTITLPAQEAAPSVEKQADETFAELNKSPLAKRVFDCSAEIINAILSFERDPSRENAVKLEETRKSGSRALAAIEIWMHQMSATMSAKPTVNESRVALLEQI